MTQEMYRDIVGCVRLWVNNCSKDLEVVFHLVDGTEIAIDADVFAKNQFFEGSDYITINYEWYPECKRRKRRGRVFVIPFSKIVYFELREFWDYEKCCKGTHKGTEDYAREC